MAGLVVEALKGFKVELEGHAQLAAKVRHTRKVLRILFGEAVVLSAAIPYGLRSVSLYRVLKEAEQCTGPAPLGVKVKRDVAYGTSQRSKLDVYMPEAVCLAHSSQVHGSSAGGQDTLQGHSSTSDTNLFADVVVLASTSQPHCTHQPDGFVKAGQHATAVSGNATVKCAAPSHASSPGIAATHPTNSIPTCFHNLEDNLLCDTVVLTNSRLSAVPSPTDLCALGVYAGSVGPLADQTAESTSSPCTTNPAQPFHTVHNHSFPVVFFVHGGIWASGEKWHYAPLAVRLAQEGCVVVVPSYTLYPEALAHTMALQVSEALSWTMDNIQHFGGDPHNITTSGHSAGAHLMMMALLYRAVPELAVAALQAQSRPATVSPRYTASEPVASRRTAHMDPAHAYAEKPPSNTGVFTHQQPAGLQEQVAQLDPATPQGAHDSQQQQEPSNSYRQGQQLHHRRSEHRSSHPSLYETSSYLHGPGTSVSDIMHTAKVMSTKIAARHTDCSHTVYETHQTGSIAAASLSLHEPPESSADKGSQTVRPGQSSGTELKTDLVQGGSPNLSGRTMDTQLFPTPGAEQFSSQAYSSCEGANWTSATMNSFPRGYDAHTAAHPIMSAGNNAAVPCQVDTRKPTRFIGMSGIYNILHHYEIEKMKGISELSVMKRAMGGRSCMAQMSPAILVSKLAAAAAASHARKAPAGLLSSRSTGARPHGNGSHLPVADADAGASFQAAMPHLPASTPHQVPRTYGMVQAPEQSGTNRGVVRAGGEPCFTLQANQHPESSDISMQAAVAAGADLMTDSHTEHHQNMAANHCRATAVDTYPIAPYAPAAGCTQPPEQSHDPTHAAACALHGPAEYPGRPPLLPVMPVERKAMDDEAHTSSEGDLFYSAFALLGEAIPYRAGICPTTSAFLGSFDANLRTSAPQLDHHLRFAKPLSPFAVQAAEHTAKPSAALTDLLPPCIIMSSCGDHILPWHEGAEMCGSLTAAGVLNKHLIYNSMLHMDFVTGWRTLPDAERLQRAQAQHPLMDFSAPDVEELSPSTVDFLRIVKGAVRVDFQGGEPKPVQLSRL